MNLKPQDIVILLKLCGYEESRPAYSIIAADLGMSPSEVNGALKRLQAAGLIHGPEMGQTPILAATEEFLIHGVKYAFPAKRGHFTRGMPTSYAAEPLNSLIAAGDDPIPVWPDPTGKKRGISLAPLYRSVPEAAKRDPLLYQRLAILDAIRSGGARQRKLAEKELVKNLRKRDGKL
ncbi:MAG TPA: hypothetical protein PLP07_08475 [Pyrinomonadaceae bacterium]|nr:hypothetical protein [Chloracidobacterium sp.]MBP9934817.1 hypothetical protein [Pyrinomonadaceae bacterium]MBK7803153.1 hypothetical protein [Chloracidobacterium sp.]MBK9438201.1 hypothetical protein [Chloracidobacterium sp.]MBK9767603.1 hypothetical protein [Chloracidobacterium sp.]